MSIPASVAKVLYAKSENKCAFPNCNFQLTNDKNQSEMAHIISGKTNGPRHIPNYNNYTPRFFLPPTNSSILRFTYLPVSSSENTALYLFPFDEVQFFSVTLPFESSSAISSAL